MMLCLTASIQPKCDWSNNDFHQIYLFQMVFVSPLQFRVGLNNFPHFSHFLHRLLKHRQTKEPHLISDVLHDRLWHHRDPVLAFTQCLSAEFITNAVQWPLRCLNLEKPVV